MAGKPDAVACLSANECLRRLKEAKILAARDQNTGPASEVMGVKVEQIPFAELNEAWKQADKDGTRAVADRWSKTAKQIEGVSRETLETSAAMYLAEKALLKKHGANGITINGLGGFYGGHIHAYPCLACRTKLCAEPVGDLEKLFRMWDQWSWHRVTFYGDLKEPIYALADAAGWKVVEEA